MRSLLIVLSKGCHYCVYEQTVHGTNNTASCTPGNADLTRATIVFANRLRDLELIFMILYNYWSVGHAWKTVRRQMVYSLTPQFPNFLPAQCSSITAITDDERSARAGITGAAVIRGLFTGDMCAAVRCLRLDECLLTFCSV